jgi:hypothetical protein
MCIVANVGTNLVTRAVWYFNAQIFSRHENAESFPEFCASRNVNGRTGVPPETRPPPIIRLSA